MKKNKAQTTLEVAVLITCIVAALIAMAVYLKRGMQGRFRQLADELGEQYAPKKTTGSSVVYSYSNTTDTVITWSEKAYNEAHGTQIDFNDDGDFDDTDVFATETNSILNKGWTNTSGNENVRKLGSSLFDE